MPALSPHNIPVRYADAHAVSEHGWYGYFRAMDLSDNPTSDTDVKVYDLSRIGAGMDLYSQTSTYQRANMKALMADYPDTFTEIGYNHVHVLAIVADNVTEDLAELLNKLADDYPVYDEEAMSEIESEEITESISAYVTSDIRGEFDEVTRERWDDLTADEQHAAILDACEAVEYYPEHSGLDVLWRYDNIVPTLTARLTADR